MQLSIPGTLENTANGNMYLCSVDEAVIPVQVSWSALIMEQRIGFERPMAVYFTNYAGATFLGWFYWGKPYDFNSTVGFDMTLTAGWAPKSIDYKLPSGTTEIGEAAFEGTPLKSVEIPANCTFVYPDAFKDCAGLKQISIRSASTNFSPTAFSGCSNVYIFAPGESGARYLCTEDNGFVFVETFR